MGMRGSDASCVFLSFSFDVIVSTAHRGYSYGSRGVQTTNAGHDHRQGVPSTLSRVFLIFVGCGFRAVGIPGITLASDPRLCGLRKLRFDIIQICRSYQRAKPNERTLCRRTPYPVSSLSLLCPSTITDTVLLPTCMVLQ